MNKLKGLFILCFFILNAQAIFAQNEANIWYFGDHAGLDFNSGSPVALTDGQIKTEEGCSAISDNNGNLLFYTDGVTVWNKANQVMLNGTGLKGDTTSSQSAIIVPKPEDSNKYYIFTVDYQIQSDGLQYSEVDMSLDGGLGGITTIKNIMLHTPTTEHLSAIKSAAANEYWVVSHKWDSDEFMAYNVSSFGVNHLPVISAVGQHYGGDWGNSVGIMKFSPNGQKLAISCSETVIDLQLFDFNSSSGIISNSLDMSTNVDPIYSGSGIWGIEFSPNSKMLYGSTIFGVYQFNLEAGSCDDIINSRIQIGYKDASALQLGPDDKIYIVPEIEVVDNEFTGTGFLNMINKPNIVGAGCDYQEGTVDLLGGNTVFGLPHFITSKFYFEGAVYKYTCFEAITEFFITDAVDSVVWDFGDPSTGLNNTSVELSPTHVFSNPGTFDVTIEATLNGTTIIKTIDVIIHGNPIANLVQDLIV